MRKAMAVLMLLLCIAPAIHSQANEFPPCSAAELAVVLDQRGEFDALFDLARGDEDTADFLLAYIEAQIQWREELWTDLPSCAEAIETAALLSETTSDIASTAALTTAGVPLSANPYLTRRSAEGKDFEIIDRHFDGLAALLESGDRPEKPLPGQRSLDGCFSVDMQVLLDVLIASEQVIVSGTEVRSAAAVAEYAGAMLGWRDDIWAQLAPCGPAIGLGQLLSQTASDLVTGIALVFVGIAGEENPYNGLLQEQLIELGETKEALLIASGAAGDAEVVAPLENPLPSCSAPDLASVIKKLAPLSDLVTEALVMESIDDLLNYINRMMDWREKLWSDVPLCAESVEISLVATNSASDLAAALALLFAGKSVEETPYWLSSLDGLQAVIEWTAETRVGADGSRANAQSNSLPHCTEAAREALRVNVEQVILYSHLISEAETLDDLLSFGEAQMAVRQVLWKQQPPCQEAVRGALLIIQLTGDALPAFALMMFGGVPTADNPYMEAIGSTQERVRALASAVEDD